MGESRFIPIRLTGSAGVCSVDRLDLTIRSIYILKQARNVQNATTVPDQLEHCTNSKTFLDGRRVGPRSFGSLPVLAVYFSRSSVTSPSVFQDETPCRTRSHRTRWVGYSDRRPLSDFNHEFCVIRLSLLVYVYRNRLGLMHLTINIHTRPGNARHMRE